MLRHVMVRLEQMPPESSELGTALSFAQGYGATVTGLHVRPPEPLTFPSDSTFYPAARLAVSGVGAQLDGDRRISEQEDERQRRLVAEFERRAGAAGVPYRLALRTGPIFDEIEAAARLADLLVVARDPAECGRTGSMLESLVRRVPHPVLVGSSEARPWRRLGVAYDGSLGARRALAAAADIAATFTPRIEDVVLIEVSTLAHADGERLLEAGRYLELYGVPHRTITATGRPSERIVELAGREDVDLLCMGAYGHWAMRDLLMGSITQEVVKLHPRPILLCH